MPINLPNLFLLPDFDVGIPVVFAIHLFNLVMPSALFQLKDRPGILNFDFLAMIASLIRKCRKANSRQLLLRLRCQNGQGWNR